MPFKRLNENNKILILLSSFFAGLCIVWILYSFFGHSLVKAIYEGRSFWILNGIIEGQENYPVEHYFENAEYSFLFLNGSCLVLFILTLSFLYLSMEITLGLLGFAGMLLILVSTSKYGAGLSPDSVNFIAAARSLLSGQGYLNHDGTVFVWWPPLYPTILAAFGLFGIDPLYAARFFNAFVFGGLVFAAGYFYHSHIKRKFLVLWGAFAVLLSFPHLTSSVMAWSDPLFSLFVILFFITLDRFLKDNRISTLIFLSFIVALACLQRLIGVTLIMTGLILIVFSLSKTPLMKRLKYGMILCMISAAPTCIWMARNYLLTSTLNGPRGNPSGNLIRDFSAVLDVISSWLVPAEISYFHRLLVAVSVISLISLIYYFFCSKDQKELSHERTAVFSTGIFLFIYIMLLIVSAAKTSLGPVSNRYLSPIYFIVFYWILKGCENTLDGLKGSWKNKKFVMPLVYMLLMCWLIFPAIRVTEKISAYLQSGVREYSKIVWRESPLIRWLQTNTLDGQIFSNASEAVYILTGKKVKLLYLKDGCRGSDMRGDDGSALEESLSSNRKTYLVWSDRIDRRDLRNVQDCRFVFHLEEIKTFADGAIYLLKKA